VAFDIETNSKLSQSEAVVAGFSLVTDRVRAYFPLRHPGSTCIDDSVAWEFVNRVVNIVPEVWMHNSSFDMRIAMREGVSFNDYATRDTILGAYLLNEPELALKTLVKKHLGISSPTYEEITMGYPATKLPSSLVGPYCISDSLITLKLADWMLPRLKELGLYRAFTETECPFAHVVAHMEMVGFKFDLEFMEPYRKSIFEQTKVLSDELKSKLGDIDFNSSDQLSKLFDRGVWDIGQAIKTRKWDKTHKWSINSQFLSRYAAKGSGEGKEIAAKLLTYRKLNKLATTYTDGLIDAAKAHSDGRIRANFNQTVTRTGRASSSKPNLQNIPIRSEEGQQIRKAFISNPGWVLSDTDLSQVELRIIAHRSQDLNMLSIYFLGQDINGVPTKDLHENMQNYMKNMFKIDIERRIAKNINFGKAYGQGDEKFALTYLGGKTPETMRLAKKANEAYFGSYKSIKPMHQRFLKFVEAHQYVVLVNGQRVWFDAGKEHYGDILNAPIQGDASVVLKQAMINILRIFKEKDWLFNRVKIVCSVHDEAILELREDIKDEANTIIRSCFEHTTNQLGFSVPMLAEPTCGKNWLEAHA
jgi:DNA polymerase-1